jgi:hypothetical protein
MHGNVPVRFLGGPGAAMRPAYPAWQQQGWCLAADDDGAIARSGCQPGQIAGIAGDDPFAGRGQEDNRRVDRVCGASLREEHARVTAVASDQELRQRLSPQLAGSGLGKPR